MKKVRKYISLVLCFCLSAYTLPSFAGASLDVETDYVKVELSESAMSETYGSNGNIDATLADYKVKGSTASAVIANRSTLGCNYSLDMVDYDGQVLETLASGLLQSNSAMLISGTPSSTTSPNKIVQVKLWNTGVPGLLAKDISFKP